MPSLPLEYILPVTVSEQRLDAVLGSVFPGLGLRGRRRLWTWCLILVNGKPAAPGHMINAGDILRVESRSPVSGSGRSKTSLHLVSREGSFLALAKPPGLHTARIAGSPEQSLEEVLEREWTVLAAEFIEQTSNGALLPRLLTRLDKDTSGLVLAALTDEAEQLFREQERRGEVEKTYRAVISGCLSGELLLTNRLLTNNRVRTYVLDEHEADSTRYTLVRPLEYGRLTSGEEVTLVEAVIRRGARHQIRAHLARAGCPIIGDVLYGGPAGLRLYLHHCRSVMPGFSAQLPVEWRPDMIL